MHANSDFSTWITNLYCYLPWSEVFACKPATFGAELQVCMGPRHHLSFCASNTAWLAPELLVSMGPNPHLWFLHAKQRILDWTKKYLSHRCNLSFCASNQSDLHQNDKFIMVPALISCKTATLRPDLQVCMGPRPHLWFLHTQLRILDQNFKSLWVPDLICGFVDAKQRD